MLCVVGFTLFAFLGWALFLFLAFRIHQSRKVKLENLKSFPLEEPTEVQQIREDFEKIAEQQPPNASYEESAAIVSTLISQGDFLKVEHLRRENAQRLFWIHRFVLSVVL